MPNPSLSNLNQPGPPAPTFPRYGQRVVRLVDLKTNLKDLKFGMDRVGGGNSGQPYETFPIPSNLATPLITDYWQNNNTGLDYPIRGGSLTGNAGDLSYTLAAQIDKDRIQKFLKDAPRGPQFIQKQLGLVASNPLMETGAPSAVFNGLQGLLGVLIGQGGQLPYTSTGNNNQYYNKGRSLLAQVIASGTGIHIPYDGSDVPIDTNARYYTDVVGQQISIGPGTDLTQINRLLMLQVSKLISGFSANQTVELSGNAISLGISAKTSLLFDYPGGPGSSYGIGNTTIARAVNSSDAYNLTDSDVTSDLFPNVFTMTYEDIRSAQNNTAATIANSTRTRNRNSTILNDFRYTTGAPSGSYLWTKKQGVDVRFYTSASVDKMNADMTNLKLVSEDPFQNIVQGAENDDMIKFGFECMSNDNPGQSVPLYFRAFLTRGISDSHQAELNSFKYMGRGETFHTYQGFNRSIGFGFKIVAFSKDELIPLYNKLNYLVSQVYPDYSNSGIMRAPLVKVTIGDYLYRMPGFLTNVNLSIEENTTWETNLDGNFYQLPKMINVDIDFKPIFNDLPRRNTIDSTSGAVTGSAIIGWSGGNKNYYFINPPVGTTKTADIVPLENVTPAPGFTSFASNF